MIGPWSDAHDDGLDVDEKVLRQCARLVTAAAVVLVCIGAAGLTGWALRLRLLTDVLPGTASMRPNTAACVAALGVSLWCGRPGTARRWRPVGAVGAGLILVVASVTLAEYVTGTDLLVDRLLFGSDPAMAVQAYPGRMAAPTAAALLLLSVAELALPGAADRPGRRVIFGQALALAACALGMLGLYGYAYQVPEFASPLGVTAMALHTAVALTVGSVATFLSRPRGGPARVLVTRAKSAMMTRRILLATLLIPPVFGWLRLVGEGHGAYGLEFGVAVLVAANGATFIVITFITGARAVRLEAGRGRAEAALAWHSVAAAMAEAAPDALVGVDAQGTVVLVNASAERLYGRPREDLLGRPVDLLVPPEAVPSIHAAHRTGGLRRPDEGQHSPDAVLRVRHHDGTEIPAQINLATVDTGGRRLVVAAVHDVTERVRYEHRLREKNAELQQASQAKDAFLATMSHELRTPLNSIIGFTGTLLMGLPGPLTGQQAHQLRLVETAGQHLLSLIDDVLELAKVEAGQPDVRPEPVECTAVVREATEYMRPLADQKDLPLIVELPRNECVATVDRRALSQILINLIGNAIKFTAAGEVRVTLTHQPDQSWAITVSDTGPGIHPDAQARIFDAFHRTADARARCLDGAGLGLFISRTLAGLMDCPLTLTSTPGEGATFTLTLATGPEATRTPAPARGRELPSSAVNGGRTLRAVK
jgi:PAS domain S-box-containing protein